jgi:hypothetical protein
MVIDAQTGDVKPLALLPSDLGPIVIAPAKISLQAFGNCVIQEQARRRYQPNKKMSAPYLVLQRFMEVR